MTDVGLRRMVGLPHVTPVMAARYRDLGVSFVDAAGNCWLESPEIKLWVEGRRPERLAAPGEERPSRAFTPAGLRVVLALLVRPELVAGSVRELARASMVSVGAAQHARSDLHAEGFVRSVRGRNHVVEHDMLARRWLEGYVVRLVPTLRSRGCSGPEPAWWAEHGPAELARGFLSGEAGLVMRGHGLRSARHTVIYGTPPWEDAVRLGRLRSYVEDERRLPEVRLRELFWSPDLVEPDNPWPGSAPSLVVYADASHSGDPRVRALAEEMWDEDDDLRRLH
ncbi:type IV toxin-antitoxin system AbiEi family antitoxin [Arsenicicoccus dermatophilus]|uniref:type IV toxin-antitoxin system AbiEi family antitoxin n=1 Tax=Arsenicicoccus dermatophilus TaxID=1076331 RepID=UPI0039173AE8